MVLPFVNLFFGGILAGIEIAVRYDKAVRIT
jgi:hypothetical protein